MLFVYGTLRGAVGHPMHELLDRHASRVAGGRLQARLYAVDGYPGAVLSNASGDQVTGELLRIDDDALLARLDDYEECSARFPEPHEYRRERVTIRTDSGEAITAWTYLYNRGTASLAPIPSGDYLDWLRQRP